MFIRQRLSKSLVFLLLLGMLSTFYPIRNASDQLNNKEASAYGSTFVNYLSLGDSSTCAITNSGGVKCWGNNDGGQLGRTGLGLYSTSLVDVTDLTSGASAVSINGTFACAITSTNGVKCWGNNSSGQLGNGTLTTSRVPVDVSGLTSGVSEISTGSSHSCAVTTSGGVKCWGSNSNGQLGNGTTTNSSTAVDVTGLSSGVEAVATGSAYSCALTTAGGVKCWGSGAYGQIGNGSFSDQTTPVDASGLTSGVSRVAAGLWHVCAAMTSGSVKCWGENQYKQLGNNSTTDSNTPIEVSGLTGVSGVAAGGYSSCALKDGGVQCWGRNDSGQLGNKTTVDSATPVSVHTSSSDSTPLSGVSEIATGTTHACALMAVGDLKCWGGNGSGQLGRGNLTVNETTPANVSVSGFSFGIDTSSPSFSAAAVNSAGTQLILQYSEALSATTASASDFAVTVSGVSRLVSSVAVAGSTVVLTLASAVSHGQVATVAYTDPSGGNDASAVQDASGNDAASFNTSSGAVTVANHVVGSQQLLSMGFSHTCAVTPAGGVKCWGANTNGALGNGAATNSATPVDVTGLSDVVAISSGWYHTCARTSSGGVKCWGYGPALGDGTSLNRSTPVNVLTAGTDQSQNILTGVAAITSGGRATCALMINGGVKCWGFNNTNQLGNGTTTNATWPVDVQTSATDSSPLVGVTAVAAGFDEGSDGASHACALMVTGGVKCWGHNKFGQLGDGTSTSRSTPVNVLTSGTDQTQNPLSGITAISVGKHTTCAVTSTNSAKCWGVSWQNVNSMTLGNGTEASESLGDASGHKRGSKWPVDVLASGTPSASPVQLTGISAIDVGYHHTCAVLASGGVKCWGNTYNGDGPLANRTTPVNVLNSGTDQNQNLLSGATAVSVGEYFTCVLLDSGAIKCWGSNGSGQIGDGTTTNPRLYPVNVVGGFSFGADATEPTFMSAATSADGTTITLTYSESLSATTASASAFSVVVGGSSRSVSSAVVSGSTVVLTLASAVGSGQSVTVAYTDPSGSNDANAVQDSAGNDAASLSVTSVTNNSTADQSVPTFVSAATSADGTTITLTYSESLSATTASASAFSVVVGGSSRSVSSAVVSGSTVVLTLTSPVAGGQSLTVAYTDPSGSNDANAVQDSAGNDAASLSATSVTNNVPQPSSGGAAPTNGTTTSTTSTTAMPTTTIATAPGATTTTTTTIRQRRNLTTTSTSPKNRQTSSTTTSTTVARVSTTTVFMPLAPLAPLATTPSPNSTTTSSTTTTIASASITSVASGAIQTLQQAEEKLKTFEAQTSTAANDLRAAQIQLGESRVAVLDPKSALVVAVNIANERVASLSAANASTTEIAAALTQLEDLKIAIAQSVTISLEKIAAAQAKLAAVLSDPSASAKQVAEAKAELVSARVPALEVVTAILNSASTDSHLAPVIIPGVVDNAGSGQIVFLDGSIEKKVEIVRINGSAIRMTSTDGFTLNISTRDKDGQPLQFNSRGGIVVKHGNFISISGEGFAPGTLAKTWLFSSPRELGNLNVSTDGSFAADLPITDDVPVGFHVGQVDGLSPDGEVRSLSLDVEILPTEGQAEYDPIAKRLAVASLIAQAMALLALSKRRDEGDDDEEREQAEVSEVGVDQVTGSGGLKQDVYAPPVIRSIDGLLQQIPSQIASTQQLLARIIRDGVYLRALTGVGGVAVAFSGVMVGFFAAKSVGFEAMSPSFSWLLALVVLGSLDALAGGMAALTIITVTAISGGIDSTDAIRGVLGLAVLSFAIPLVASTTRPFRRNSAKSENWLWTRTSDVVLLSLFGAWAAGAMYDALPGLYGFTSSAAGRTTTVQVMVLATLIVRFMLEGVATKVTGSRLAYLAGPSLPEPSAGRSVFAIIVRTVIMLFVAEAFIGNNFALWIGAAMYAIPKLIALVADRFPKSTTLRIWLPAGLLRTVVMLFVARVWASNISSFSENPATQLQAAFVLLGIPSLVLTSLGWFAGGEQKWRSTPVSKVLGIVVLAIGVLTVRGVLFA